LEVRNHGVPEFQWTFITFHEHAVQAVTLFAPSSEGLHNYLLYLPCPSANGSTICLFWNGSHPRTRYHRIQFEMNADRSGLAALFSVDNPIYARSTSLRSIPKHEIQIETFSSDDILKADHHSQFYSSFFKVVRRAMTRFQV
jgi:hypothetical protein